MESRYYKIKTFREVKRLIKACLKTGYCCYDFETSGDPIYTKKFHLTILSITFQAGSGISIPLNHPETKSYCELGYNWKKVLKYFGRKIIENDDPNLTKIGWNLKFDNQIWLRFGIRPSGRMLDGMLAKYILNEERPNDLKSMVDRYLPEFGGYEKEKGFDKIPWDKKPLEQLCKYGCMDTDCTFRLTLFFESRLIEKGLYNLYRNLIMTASIVLTEVERNGLFVNRSFNEELLESYKNNLEQAKNKCLNLKRVQKFSRKQIEARVNEYISKIEEELDDLDSNDPKDKRKIQSREQKIANIRAGIFSSKKEKSLIEPINLGSPKQLKNLLFSESGFNLPIIKYTDKKEPSTDEDTLKELRLTIKNPENPKAVFLDNLLDYRGVQKMYTTFIEGWHDKLQDDSRLHGRFLIIGTTSGRLSCLSGDTIIKTSVGDLRLDYLGTLPKETLNNIKVITQEGWKPIINFIHKGIQDMYQVELEDGTTINCTLDHIFITNQGEKKLREIYNKDRNTIDNKIKLLKYVGEEKQ